MFGDHNWSSFHVCDESGRTVNVFHKGKNTWERHTYGGVRGFASARQLAEERCDALNTAGAHTAQAARGHYAVMAREGC
jgi:hypothetical protein